MPEKTITAPADDEQIDSTPPEGGEPPLEPEPPKKAPAKPTKEERAEQKELDRLREENRLLQQSERFWQQKAAGRKDAGDEPPADEVPEDDVDVSDLVAEQEDGKEPEKEQTPDEFIDELSKLGPKALQKVVARMGYVNKADAAKLATDIAKRVVERERGRMTSDAELISRFPDLRDQTSELYEETAKRFRAAVARDPKSKNSPVTLFLAAEAAELALGAGQRNTRSRTGGDYRDRDDEEERERVRNINAQQGDRGRGGRSGDYGDDDELGPEARQIVNAFGVDEKAYRAERAKDRKRR